MNYSFRLAGAIIVASALVAGVANPATALPSPAPSTSGELITSYGTDCGVLTVTPNTPTYGENVTVSLSQAKPNAQIPLAIAPGIYKNGHWFPLTPGDNPADGKVAVGPDSISSITLSTDANGAATISGPVGSLLTAQNPLPSDYANFILTLIPTLWIVQCDAGMSFAQVRGARASLTGSLSLDPESAGAIIGSGLPANTSLTGVLVNMADYPDPGIATWNAKTNGSPSLGQFTETVDADGNLASTPLFSDLAPGRYALAVIHGAINVDLLNLLKAEYVITVAQDLTVSMVLWAEPSVSAVGSTTLSLTSALGDQVVGSQAKFDSVALKPYSNWSMTVRSAPQVIAHGIVGVSGLLSGSAALPSGLEAGWHSLTFTSTNAGGTTGDTMYWFKIGNAGELLQVSATEPAADVVAVPAMLAATGVDGVGLLTLAGGVLALGLVLALLARRRGMLARP